MNHEELLLQLLTSQFLSLELDHVLQTSAMDNAMSLATDWRGQSSEHAYRALARKLRHGAEQAAESLARITGADIDQLTMGDETARATMRRHITKSSETAMNRLREAYIRQYGFAVLTDEAVEWMALRLIGHRVLEVGAGNGYLALRLRQAGVQMNATDMSTLEDNHYGLGNSYHTDVEIMEAKRALKTFRPTTLVWSRPVPETASGRALEEFDGQMLIYIGEQNGGCTGGPLFEQLLTERYREPENFYIPSFPGVHDWIAAYEKRD